MEMGKEVGRNPRADGQLKSPQEWLISEGLMEKASVQSIPEHKECGREGDDRPLP